MYPCKIGDPVWVIVKNQDWIMKKVVAKEIHYNGDGFSLVVSTGFETFTLQESEYHLTLESAKSKLKEMQNHG